MRPGDVVTAEFPGAQGVKRRPAVVVSSDVYHATRPDVILSLLTTQTAQATNPTDYLLRDWTAAGLHAPSAFRSFLGMVSPSQVTVIGRLSARDWLEVQKRLGLALAAVTPAQLQAEQTAERERREKDAAVLKAETCRAEKERLAAKLRALGINPDQV
jgi:mRNA interferase MazF